MPNKTKRAYRPDGLISSDNAINILNERINKFGGTRKYADHVGVCYNFVDDTLNERTAITGKIAQDLGIKVKNVIYYEITRSLPTSDGTT